MLRKTINMSKKDAQTLKKIIADSSPFCNKHIACMRQHMTKSYTGATALYVEKILQGVLRGSRMQCMVHS
jgi:hypothetical protein